jgi:hypothetical protein
MGDEGPDREILQNETPEGVLTALSTGKLRFGK